MTKVSDIRMICDEYAASCGEEVSISSSGLDKLTAPPLCPRCGLPMCDEQTIETARRFFSSSVVGKLRRSIWLLRNYFITTRSIQIESEAVEVRITNGGIKATGRVRRRRD